jgi:hypothetical protein
MVWVVNGVRLKRDYPRFQKGWVNFKRTNKEGFFCVDFVDESFSASWLESSVPVIFDFQGAAPSGPLDKLHEILWCLLPGRAGKYAIVIGISRDSFVKTASSRSQLLPVKEIIKALMESMQPPKTVNKMIIVPPRYIRQPRYIKRRRRF